MRGQSLVETAITLPVIVLLALGVTDIGRAFYYREAVTNSVRQALRLAVSQYQQSTANSVCSGTGGGNGAQVFHWVCGLNAVAGQPYAGGLVR
jgi:hypothetical protein